MKEIPLTQGRVAIVDDRDHERLVAMGNWYAATTRPGHFVALTWLNRKNARMHRIILNAPQGLDVDHINHNTLDNQRHNLRLCTHRQNLQNQLKQKGRSSKHKGVYWHKNNKRWVAKIKINGLIKSLGCFGNEDDAGNAYNEAAKEHFGEFAYLNDLG